VHQPLPLDQSAPEAKPQFQLENLKPTIQNCRVQKTKTKSKNLAPLNFYWNTSNASLTEKPFFLKEKNIPQQVSKINKLK